jgi:hypothetical protein
MAVDFMNIDIHNLRKHCSVSSLKQESTETLDVAMLSTESISLNCLWLSTKSDSLRVWAETSSWNSSQNIRRKRVQFFPFSLCYGKLNDYENCINSFFFTKNNENCSLLCVLQLLRIMATEFFCTKYVPERMEVF